jgi:hypothetical protein
MKTETKVDDYQIRIKEGNQKIIFSLIFAIVNTFVTLQLVPNEDPHWFDPLFVICVGFLSFYAMVNFYDHFKNRKSISQNTQRVK